MVLSKRERFIALTTLAAVGLLGLDRLVLSPLMAASAELDGQINACRAKLQDAQAKFDGRKRRMRQWTQMQNSGLRRKDDSEAESQMMNSIRDWAQEAGLTLLSVKPDRTEKEKGFSKSTFRVTGSGGMAEIGRFLWYVQNAAMPARIVDLQITTRKEATDDLSLQLGISTVRLLTESERDPLLEPGGPAARPREVQP